MLLSLIVQCIDHLFLKSKFLSKELIVLQELDAAG